MSLNNLISLYVGYILINETQHFEKRHEQLFLDVAGNSHQVADNVVCRLGTPASSC